MKCIRCEGDLTVVIVNSGVRFIRPNEDGKIRLIPDDPVTVDEGQIHDVVCDECQISFDHEVVDSDNDGLTIKIFLPKIEIQLTVEELAEVLDAVGEQIEIIEDVREGDFSKKEMYDLELAYAEELKKLHKKLSDYKDR